MAKARRLITENMKAVDVAAELLDARIPYSSANPMIAELTAGKPRLIILNKSDMADPGETKKWKDWFQSQGLKTIAMDSRTGKSRKMLFQAVREAARPVLKKWEARGMKNRSVRLMILGIPNVGKSTLINSLSGTAAARTANTPGHTRGKQWVHLADGLDLLDTPGVLWPKLDNQTAAVRLAATGAIADDVFDLETVVPALLKMLTEKAPRELALRYGTDPAEHDGDSLLEEIARRRGCLLPGGAIDWERARRVVLNDFQDGRLGKLTLDSVPGEEGQA